MGNDAEQRLQQKWLMLLANCNFFEIVEYNSGLSYQKRMNNKVKRPNGGAALQTDSLICSLQ